MPVGKSGSSMVRPNDLVKGLPLQGDVDTAKSEAKSLGEPVPESASSNASWSPGSVSESMWRSSNWSRRAMESKAFGPLRLADELRKVAEAFVLGAVEVKQANRSVAMTIEGLKRDKKVLERRFAVVRHVKT